MTGRKENCSLQSMGINNLDSLLPLSECKHAPSLPPFSTHPVPSNPIPSLNKQRPYSDSPSSLPCPSQHNPTISHNHHTITSLQPLNSSRFVSPLVSRDTPQLNEANSATRPPSHVQIDIGRHMCCTVGWWGNHITG